MSTDYYDDLERLRREEDDRRQRELQRIHDEEDRRLQNIRDDEYRDDEYRDDLFYDRQNRKNRYHEPKLSRAERKAQKKAGREAKKSWLRLPFKERLRRNYEKNKLLFIRRVIVSGILLAMLSSLLIYLVTPLSDPLKEFLHPAFIFAEEKITWLKNADKEALFVSVAVLVLSKVGIIAWVYNQLTGKEL